MGAPGSEISEFGTVYGNFFSGDFGAGDGHAGYLVCRPVVSGVSSRFLREVFGNSRSLPEHFPNTSRRKQAANDGKPVEESEKVFWPAGG
jgi:hypothetical protein